MTNTDNGKPKAGPARDLWFDPFASPVPGSPLDAFAADLQAILEANETRTRRRKPDDRRRFIATVRALVANLAASVLEPSGTGAMAVPLANLMSPGAARYGHPMVPVKVLKAVVLACRDAGLVNVSPGYRGRTTTMRPTEALARELASRGVTFADITRGDDEAEELIILVRKRKEELADGVNAMPRTYAERVGYLDTPDTLAMRDEVRELNAWLALANVGFADNGMGQVDIGQRRLRRYFTVPPGATPRFDLGGRLFGAFWTNLERSRRRTSLRIEGEPIAEVDYSALFIRLAYAGLGVQLPVGLEDDPYAIAGFPDGHRASLKMAVNAFLFSDGPLTRLPPDIVANGWPRGWTVSRTQEAVLKAHPALGEVFGTRIGFELMHMESTILLACLKRMREAGLIGLPLHDAVLVPMSRGEEAKLIMEEKGERIAGVRLPVGLKVGTGCD